MFRLPISWFGRHIRVALIGGGGSGSAMVQELVRLSTTLNALDCQTDLDVTIFDGSNVTEANITRQVFFPTQVGQNKADALVWTANNLHGKNWKAVPKNLSMTNSDANSFDLIITAVDKPSVRYEISKLRPYSQTLWLDMGNGAVDGQVILGELWNSEKKELPHICDLYDYENLSDEDSLKKSCSASESVSRQELGVNQFAARIAGQLMWNLFRHGAIESHGAHFNARLLEVDPIKIDEQTWAMYGYVPPKKSD